MTRSATDVMQDIIFTAVIDSIAALKTASKGLPNTLLRDLNAVHANTTFADLPKELQAAIGANVRAAFTRLLKEGYSVSNGQPAPSRQPMRDPGGQPNRQRRPGMKGDRPDGRPPRRSDGPGSDGRPPRRTDGPGNRSNRGGKPRGPGRP